jgi:hypothetical protein
MSILTAQLPATAPDPPNGAERSWKPLLKVLSVLAGYSLALLVACAAVYVRQLNMQGTDAEADSGMCAWGDTMLFFAVFGGAALLPTGLGLYFLRPLRMFWNILAIAALALAATGPVCAVGFEALRHMSNPPVGLRSFADLGIFRSFASPLLAFGFVLCACLAPTRFSRWVLLGATVVESLAAAYAVFHWWIVPSLN